ncbi:Replication protein P [Pseudomonas sp. CK-NBRI-02]|uniref:replication protein P n=1 Tax=Pseudomonas sp. CK-NBRI-02 TaxID=2249759 RepID=UPI00039EE9CD|nr:replication protein P [Pseudomonas sp. CK-NBRI-02]TYO83344.1 Replication protein P [Pseudomonas sp. CK-NBRI-02]
MNQVSVVTHGLWAKIQSGQHIPAGYELPADVKDELNRKTAAVINDLFRDLRSICTGWKQAWPDRETYNASKKQWLTAFLEAGINSADQLQFGLMHCRQSVMPFIPSPGEFIQWCQPSPEMLGLPTLGAAFREACRNAHPAMAGQGKWSHDAVWHAAKESGFENLNKLPEDASSKLFERNYTIAVRRLMAGEPLQKMPLALPAKVAARRTPQIGNDALAAIRAARRQA